MPDFALLVADPSAKALRQLNIFVRANDMAFIDDLVAACRSNQTLEVLQVAAIDRTIYVQVQAKLAVLKDELFAIHTSSDVKWAFLSVVKHYQAAHDDKGMDRIDPLVLSRVFQFAGSPIRRKVLILYIFYPSISD